MLLPVGAWSVHSPVVLCLVFFVVCLPYFLVLSDGSSFLFGTIRRTTDMLRHMSPLSPNYALAGLLGSEQS